jgi:cell division protein FtsQ
MRRPNSSPGGKPTPQQGRAAKPAAPKPSAAPKAPAARKPAPAPRAAGAPREPLFGKAKQPANVTRLSPVRGPSQAVLEREQQRLAKLAKAERKQSKLINREQLAQIRRFTQGSRLRRVITLTSVGSVVLLVALVLATMFTPMMAIDEIKITGVHRMKVSAVRNAVKSLVGTPLTLVDENAIAKRLEGFPLIESFTTLSMPPHTLELNILERQPIGLVTVGGNTYLYDPAGVRIQPARTSSKYPLIVVNGDPAHSPNYREAVDVLLALPASLYPNILSIEATTKDNVLLTIRGAANRRIIWGDASQSLLKSKVLAALMKHTKHSATVTFDVSSPNTPTVRYGNY